MIVQTTPLLLLVIVPLLLLLLLLGVAKGDTERSITMYNESGSKVEIYWVGSGNQKVLQTTPNLLHGANFNLNSYVGHTFEIKELPQKRTKQCINGLEANVCGVSYFTVNDNADQIFYIRKGLLIEHEDHETIAKRSADTLLSTCESNAMKSISSSNTNTDTQTVVAAMTSCLSNNLQSELGKAKEEIEFQKQTSHRMGTMIGDYSCLDTKLKTSERTEGDVWVPKKKKRGSKQYLVDILHKDDASEIQVIHDFISPQECSAFFENTSSDSSKSTWFLNLADIAKTNDETEQNKLIQKVSKRVTDYTNHVFRNLESKVTQFGQEDIMLNHHVANANMDQEEMDHIYVPHCTTNDDDEEDCTVKEGQRIATIMMHCEVANGGGNAVVYPKSGIAIVPTVGSAIYMSHVDTKTTKQMDSRQLTEYSICPVVSDSRQLITQWIRCGVNHDHPWTMFNTPTTNKHVEL